MPNKRIFIFLLSLFLILNSCGIYKKVDQRQMPTGAVAKAKKNVEEGRGISLKGLAGGNKKTTFQFSTSNPLWRASLEVLDFIPLSTVDYAGGMIISDWYFGEASQNDSIKVTVRFLNNEISSNSLDVIVHQKICKTQINCKINKIDSKIKEELKISILKKAALIQKQDKKKKKK